MGYSARLAGLGMALCLFFQVAWVQADVREEIFDIIESASSGIDNHLLPEPIWAPGLVGAFYGGRDHAVAWDDAGQIDRVLGMLAHSHRQGLNPDDYHHSALLALKEEWNKKVRGRDRIRASFDVLLSDGVLLYARHMQQGKVDPAELEPSWNFSRREWLPEQVAANLSAAISDKKVVAIIESWEPKLPYYGLLKKELERYRSIDEQYEFVLVPDDTVLKPGMTHPNVVALREQLRRLGLVDAASAQSDVYDEGLVTAVKSFQSLHSLDSDGAVGKNSFRELNTSYAQRVDQIRVNMDRVRWISEDLAEDMVVVNIAGFELYFFREGSLSWETQVMVGTIRNETPIFQSKIKYLVLNPDWTVPRSIIRKSLFRKMQKDPGYVQEKNYKLFDSEGNEADPMQMDWASYSPNRFPYRVVQQPGPGNALGRVKFIFPNKHAVYLHDTPSRALFTRTDRAFSHGCIRVQHPLEFAERMLDDPNKWSRATIDEVIESRKMKRVNLAQPMEVILMYWTASPTIDRRIQFHPDVYNRDEKTIAALNRKD
jgi:murein L,D-transpeptidase YcbB/YkuD